MNRAPVTPKGFRDISPELAKKRREAINTLAKVLEESGFVPVETPTIEFAETLKGKYGEDEKLIYEFTDRGGRELALRYDLTVPLARFVASNLNLIQKDPFRRYQIGQVFRGEKPQKGRFREFTQFDFDSVGSSDFSEDARVIETISKCMDALGIFDYKILINDRKLFEGMEPSVVRSIDKINKIGKDEVEKEIGKELLEKIEKSKPTETLQKILDLLSNPKVQFSPTLARGLDYYTGMIFEVEIGNYGISVAGGGRYDNLIGMFASKQIPAVGGSFGFDRLIDAITDSSK